MFKRNGHLLLTASCKLNSLAGGGSEELGLDRQVAAERGDPPPMQEGHQPGKVLCSISKY